LNNEPILAITYAENLLGIKMSDFYLPVIEMRLFPKNDFVRIFRGGFLGVFLGNNSLIEGDGLGFPFLFLSFSYPSPSPATHCSLLWFTVTIFGSLSELCLLA